MSDQEPQRQYESFPIRQRTLVIFMIVLMISVAAGFYYRISTYGFQ